MALEDREKIYRSTAKHNRKYLKKLTEYVQDLVSRGRLLEARYFFLDLSQISPSHPKTIRLGYAIAIATFDNDWVLKYDKLLVDSGGAVNEVNCYRLQYYHSRNNLASCEDTCCALLESKLSLDQLSTVIEVCRLRKSYVVACSLASYLVENKLKLKPDHDKWLRQIVITKLANCIGRSYGKLPGSKNIR
ncbi:hypothetical protein ACI2KC_14800 [Pseudomonas monteilii]